MTQSTMALSSRPDEDVRLSNRHGLLRPGSSANMETTPTSLTAETQSDPQPASIFCLPLELRLMIYNLLFDSTFADDILDRQFCFPLPAILRTCTFLRVDAAKLWQEKLDLALDDAPNFNACYGDRLQKQRAAAIASGEIVESPHAMDWRAGVRPRQIHLTRDHNLRLLKRTRARLQPKAGARHWKKATMTWYKSLPKFKRPMYCD